MKTSLQTLIDELEGELREREGCNGAINIGHKSGLKQAIQIAEKLLELERQHLLDSYWAGDEMCANYQSFFNLDDHISAEEYYNNTFKQQEKWTLKR
jgi:hypothetical protein